MKRLNCRVTTIDRPTTLTTNLIRTTILNVAITTNSTTTKLNPRALLIIREIATATLPITKTNQWMTINWSTTMTTNQMTWTCFLTSITQSWIKMVHLEGAAIPDQPEPTSLTKKIFPNSEANSANYVWIPESVQSMCHPTKITAFENREAKWQPITYIIYFFPD